MAGYQSQLIWVDQPFSDPVGIAHADMGSRDPNARASFFVMALIRAF